MSIIQTIHLNVANSGIPQSIDAVQNDTDRSVKMVVDDMTLTNDMTGKISFKRADGTFYEESATLDTGTNSFTAVLDQALTCAGKTLVQLKITDTDMVSTFTFYVIVEEDTSGTVSPQEGISLQDAVDAAEDAADRAEAAVAALDGVIAYIDVESNTLVIETGVESAEGVSF